MKKNKLVYLLLFLCTITYAQENCKNFKTGQFQNIENGIVKSEIQRNDSIQIERYGQKEIKLSISWIDDCNYRLTFLEGNLAFWNARPKNKPTPDLLVKITEVHGNEYLQESKFDIGNDLVYKSTITKID